MRGVPNVVVEFLVEPFRDAAPGRHVMAARRAARTLGFKVHHGPFGSTFEGDPQASSAAVAALVEAALSAGASRVSIQVTRGQTNGGVRLPDLREALAMLIDQVERQLGAKLTELVAKTSSARCANCMSAARLRCAVRSKMSPTQWASAA